MPEGRGEGAAHYVGKGPLRSGGEVLFYQVENAVPVAGEYNLFVGEPVAVPFVKEGVANGLEILSVTVDDGKSPVHVVKESEENSLAVWAHLRTVDVEVAELAVGNVKIYGVFGREFAEVGVERNLAQHESGAFAISAGKDQEFTVGVEGGEHRIGQVGQEMFVLVGVT